MRVCPCVCVCVLHVTYKNHKIARFHQFVGEQKYIVFVYLLVFIQTFVGSFRLLIVESGEQTHVGLLPMKSRKETLFMLCFLSFSPVISWDIARVPGDTGFCYAC